MLASLSSIYDNIRSYSLSGRKPGDKRRRERYSVVFCSTICIYMVRFREKAVLQADVLNTHIRCDKLAFVEFD